MDSKRRFALSCFATAEAASLFDAGLLNNLLRLGLMAIEAGDEPLETHSDRKRPHAQARGLAEKEPGDAAGR